MTTIELQPLSLSSSGLVKMEERKRPASYETDDSAPPQKRQATANSNGGSKGQQDMDLPGRDELEVRLTQGLSGALSSELGLAPVVMLGDFLAD